MTDMTATEQTQSDAGAFPFGENTDSLDAQAALLERTLPAIARTLFAVDHGDPLSELPIGQFKMCVTLFREGRRTMSQISETLGISVSAATQMADRLERAHMVERETEPDGDKRTRYLRLTDHGETLLRARVVRRTHRARHVLADLPPHTRDEILAALQILLGACRETFGTVAPPGE